MRACPRNAPRRAVIRALPWNAAQALASPPRLGAEVAEALARLPAWCACRARRVPRRVPQAPDPDKGGTTYGRRSPHPLRLHQARRLRLADENSLFADAFSPMPSPGPLPSASPSPVGAVGQGEDAPWRLAQSSWPLRTPGGGRGRGRRPASCRARPSRGGRDRDAVAPALLAVATPPIRRPASAASSPRSIPVRKNPSVYCIPVPVVREVWRRSAKSRPSLSTPIACPIARCRCRSRRRHRTVLIAALIAAAAPAGGCQGGAGRGGRRERQSAAWCARWSTELPLRSLPAGGRNML